MDINSIKADRARGKVEYMGEEVSFQYRPAMITPENYKVMSDGQNVDELGTFFEGILASWDLTNEGQPLPITAANVAKLPLALLRAIANFIAREVPSKDLGNS